MVERSEIEVPVESEALPLELIREKARNDLYFFAKGVLGFSWLTPHIHLPLCKLLEEYDKNTRLAITLPRGWLKTTVCSQAYPLWRAIRDPNVRILLAQNTYKNAVSKLGVIKDCVEKNTLFRALFPDILPDKTCVWKADSLCLRRSNSFSESTFEAAGTRTQVTSRHYNLIIEDDTVAPDLDDLGENALCPTKEDVVQAIGWHRLVPPLLINPATDQALVVGTRWFEKDLLSWIRTNEDYYKFYNRACRENENGDACEDGKITYPERFSEGTLKEMKTALGPYIFSCLYLNKPIRSEDMLFDESWFTHYDTEPAGLITYTTVDPGGDPESSKGDVDYNVVLTCGKDIYDGRVYVLDYTRRKCSPGELIDMVFGHVRRWKPVVVGVESVAYQKTLQYWMRERMRSERLWFNIELLTHTKKSKASRIMGLQPVISSKSLLFRPTMSALINELLVFPLGSNDDLADCLASQLELWQVTSTVKEEMRKRYASDPLSLEGAIESIRGRHKEAKASEFLVFDVWNN